MTRSDLIEHLGSRFPALTPKDVELAVKTIQSAMIAQLQAGERIEIRGFGSFALSYRPPRTARPEPQDRRVRGIKSEVCSALQGR
jgi:integration host factor subunit beta